MVLQSNFPRFFIVVLFVSVLVFAVLDNSLAGMFERINFEIEPAFSYRLEYQDNVDYDSSDKISDFSNHYSPGFTFRSLGSQYTLDAQASLEIAEYTSEKDYNYVDQDYSLSLAYQVNDRLSYTFDGAYTIINDINKYWQTGDGSTAAGDVFERYKNELKTFGVTANYALSGRSSLGLFGTFSQYDTITTDSSDFYMAGALYVYKLTPRTNLQLNAQYFYYDFTYSQNVDLSGDGTFDLFSYAYTLSNYTIKGGLTHTFLNNATLMVQAGYRYTTADTSQSGIDKDGMFFKTSDSGNGDGWVAGVTLTKRFNDFELMLEGFRDLSVDNQGNTSESTRLGLTTTYDITRRLIASLVLRMQRSYVDPDDDAFGFARGRDTYSYYVGSSLEYGFYRWLQASLGHAYRYTDYKKSGSTLHGNLFYVTLKFIPLRPLVIR